MNAHIYATYEVTGTNQTSRSIVHMWHFNEQTWLPHSMYTSHSLTCYMGYEPNNFAYICQNLINCNFYFTYSWQVCVRNKYAQQILYICINAKYLMWIYQGCMYIYVLHMCFNVLYIYSKLMICLCIKTQVLYKAGQSHSYTHTYRWQVVMAIGWFQPKPAKKVVCSSIYARLHHFVTKPVALPYIPALQCIGS